MEKIEFWLNNKLLGKGYIEKYSTPKQRIDFAKSIGIEYYDTFVLPRGKYTAVSSDIKMINNYKVLETYNDYHAVNGEYSNLDPNFIK